MNSRLPLTSIGIGIESIIIAVVMFMTCGLLMFISCFIITQIYLCYKHTHIRKNRRIKQENGEIQFNSINANPQLQRSFYVTFH
ncbi:unnamed protein product [Brugia timori]|uniref:Uncharacterized protein n=1 Tax=Brugia timori TaxID=42155 RepID=A0A0R3QQS4_9BILA|nr:unnamed protein product [Brugia timori]